MPAVTARISATLAAGGPTRRALEADLGMAPGSLGAAAVSVAGSIVGHDRQLLGGEELAVVVPVAGG